ncbi:hypothetical protein VDF13_07525 [Xanthomonas campestris pv. raphani]|uniref:hypothetical protein n=1 Tax=Xanthomonas campestris TaxID=339 RepID=UPI001E6189CA|nr:hypothetical protein [Xanthomonas campestris]MCC8487142.1 hypothetical protein [Xanthomonas campestris]MEA9650016.1 hypothetical protein [Xanthomonas campestris pv. raphani]MEA9743323.1 hypothetical protein [Xanthomonas campestris pv. raphani]MEA9766931.1 hypothetical protein [Xanthomonas campestris pv. raphani]MEA9868179.1 hypothetical protein [Xanthomonas campestris pv. raphani]
MTLHAVAHQPWASQQHKRSEASSMAFTIFAEGYGRLTSDHMQNAGDAWLLRLRRTHRVHRQLHSDSIGSNAAPKELTFHQLHRVTSWR